jgi:hypothetical protein
MDSNTTFDTSTAEPTQMENLFHNHDIFMIFSSNNSTSHANTEDFTWYDDDPSHQEYEVNDENKQAGLQDNLDTSEMGH